VPLLAALAAWTFQHLTAVCYLDSGGRSELWKLNLDHEPSRTDAPRQRGGSEGGDGGRGAREGESLALEAAGEAVSPHISGPASATSDGALKGGRGAIAAWGVAAARGIAAAAAAAGGQAAYSTERKQAIASPSQSPANRLAASVVSVPLVGARMLPQARVKVGNPLARREPPEQTAEMYGMNPSPAVGFREGRQSSLARPRYAKRPTSSRKEP